MNNVRSSHNKSALFAALSLVAIVLGVSCIGFALMKIGASSVQIADIHRDNDSILYALSISPNRLTDRVDSIDTDVPNEVSYTDGNLYPVYPNVGDYIGSLSIPALELELPIYQGTDDDELEKGVGHFLQSVLPGEMDNCVLSGHRTTVFNTLGELEIGDRLTVQTSAGTFTYEVTGTRIVDKDDKTVIVPTDHAVLTLTTCYPFVYIGSAPDRFIVSADLVVD